MRSVILALLLATAACAHGPGDPINVVFTEVSIYSLPHVVVNHEFAVAQGGTVVCEGPNPQLRVAFKMVDHSHGTNVDSHVDFQIFEDEGWPLSDREDWVLVHEANRVTNNVQPDIRRVKEKLFDATGEKFFEIRLDASRPMKRIKVVAHAKMYNPVASILIRKPLDTKEAEESRVFFLALRPQWGMHVHQGTGLIRQFRQLMTLKEELVRWRSYASRVLVANRSVKDAGDFDAGTMMSVLKSPTIAREDLDQVVSELLADASRAAGRPPEKLDALGKELLGVPRLPFAYNQIHASLAERTPPLVSGAGAMQNLIVGAGNVLEQGGVRLALDRTIGQLDMALKALFYLWGTNDLAEFRSMLRSMDRALKGAIADAARLVAQLDRELGRDGAGGGWLAIESSLMYQKRWPREAAADQQAATMLLRGLFSDLLYLAIETRFNLDIADAWVTTAGKRLTELVERASELAPDPDLAYPPDLFVEPGPTTATIGSGQVATYALTVGNKGSVEREVQVLEANNPPDGWKTKITPETARLKPGEAITVRYVLGSPYYAHEPINHVSALKVGWRDEPGLVHQPQFLTRLEIAGKLAQLPGPGARRDPPVTSVEHAEHGMAYVEGRGRDTALHVNQTGDGLLVSTDGPDKLVIEPGGVGRYTVKVIHKGAGVRRVSVKLMTQVPDRWLVAIDPEEAECTPEVIQRFKMRVTAPIDLIAAREVELLLGIGYTDEFTRVDRVAFRRVNVALSVIRSRPQINGGEVRTYRARTGAATSMMFEVSNVGSVDDTFDLFVDGKPQGWYVHLDRTTVRVPHLGAPAMVPITVRPPPGAMEGEFEKIVLRAVSIGHPEVSTKQELTVTVKSPDNFALEALQKRYLVAPGTQGRLVFRARNVMDRPVRLAWKVSPRTVHPEWVTLDEPLTELGPDQEATLSVKVSIPHGVPSDRVFPVVLMALDEHGGEVVSAGTLACTIPRHRILVRAVEERIVRTRTLLIVPIEVENAGALPDDVGVILEGKRRYWARLSHRKLFLRPGQRFMVSLTVRIPVEAQAGQDADLLVQATSLTDGGARDFVRIGVAPPYVIRTNASTYGPKTKF